MQPRARVEDVEVGDLWRGFLGGGWVCVRPRNFWKSAPSLKFGSFIRKLWVELKKTSTR